MSKNQNINVRMELPDRHNLNPLKVSMESFFEFTFWMSEELDDLIATTQFKNRAKATPTQVASNRRKPTSFESRPSKTK